MVDINIKNGMDAEIDEFDELEIEAWPSATQTINPDETPLFELKSRRNKIASELVKSFQVPRWESPEIYCEFGVVEPSALAKALQKREKQKNRPDDWVAWAYCDILAPNVKAVYAVLNDDDSTRYSLREGDPTGAPTKIDHDLARALGLDSEGGSASKTFRALFFSEGDVLDLANKVFRWSAIVGDEVDEAF